MLALSLSNALPWLQGRLNGSFPSLLLNLVGLAAWIVLTIILLWKLAKASSEMGRANMRWRVLFGAIAFLPWLILAFQRDATTAFAEGFRAWAATNANAEVIRDWQANLTVDAATAPAPLWWPTPEYEAPLGVPVSRGSVSSAVAELRPDEIRVLPELEGVLLSWEGGRTGWVRFLFIGSAASDPPEQLKTELVRWRKLEAGILVGVVQHH